MTQTLTVASYDQAVSGYAGGYPGARKMAKLASPALHTGAVFDTPFETGCVVTDVTEMPHSFLALDSEGVECQFNPVMVVAASIRDYPAPAQATR